jgi:hypothetical protein
MNETELLFNVERSVSNNERENLYFKTQFQRFLMFDCLPLISNYQGNFLMNSNFICLICVVQTFLQHHQIFIN